MVYTMVYMLRYATQLPRMVAAAEVVKECGDHGVYEMISYITPPFQISIYLNQLNMTFLKLM